LNAVASDPKGPLRKEAFDLIADFITGASDVTISNKVRMRAIQYANGLIENDPYKFGMDEFIQISSKKNSEAYGIISEKDYKIIENLYITFVGFTFYYEFLCKAVKSKNKNQFAFVDCFLFGLNKYEEMIEIDNISAVNCNFLYCKIKKFNPYIKVVINTFLTGDDAFRDVLLRKDNLQNLRFSNNFELCDFSDTSLFDIVAMDFKAEDDKQGLFGNKFVNSFYYVGHKPLYFNEKIFSALFIEVTSEKQFYEKFKDFPYMRYSPPDDKK